MKLFALLALGFALAAGHGSAAPADDIAEVLFSAANGPITADSLPVDFMHLAKFVRHDAGGQVFYADGGVADGHVRHAQAQFDVRRNARDPADKTPLFVVAFELSEDSDFTFPGFAAALERRFGTPDRSADLSGAVFRTWRLMQVPGRVLTIARSQASDDGDAVIVVQLVQNP